MEQRTSKEANRYSAILSKVNPAYDLSYPSSRISIQILSNIHPNININQSETEHFKTEVKQTPKTSCISAYVCVCAQKHTKTHTHTPPPPPTHKHTDKHTHTHKHTHTQTHIHTHTYTHTHTHTHTRQAHKHSTVARYYL